MLEAGIAAAKQKGYPPTLAVSETVRKFSLPHPKPELGEDGNRSLPWLGAAFPASRVS